MTNKRTIPFATIEQRLVTMGYEWNSSEYFISPDEAFHSDPAKTLFRPNFYILGICVEGWVEYLVNGKLLTISPCAGTGIRNLGKELMTKRSTEPINLSFTHFHWDHIQGFPFFAPAYNKSQKIKIHVMGEERKFKNLKEIFSLQMQKDYFPVELDAMGAQFEFLSYGNEETFYNAKARAVPQHHKFPGGSYGLRLEDESGTLAVCTDAEHINGIDENIVAIARNADVLIHDGQYERIRTLLLFYR